MAFSKKQENLLQISEKKMCESLYYAAHKFKSIYLLKALAKLSHNLLKALAKLPNNVTTSGKPVDTQSKINVQETFILHPGRALNVFCAFNIEHAFTRNWVMMNIHDIRFGFNIVCLTSNILTRSILTYYTLSDPFHHDIMYS